MAEPRRDVKVISAPGPDRGFTFVAELGNAPFPVGPNAVDQRGNKFWHGVDAASGQRYRDLGPNRRYTEAAVYSDARVLFHAARGFDPKKPSRLVLFLHGHGSEIEATAGRDLDLPGQLDRSGINAVLIAPQLALNAQESVPGKFVEPGRAAAFADEAASVLRSMLGGDAAAWRRAPIVIVAYSGGYRTAAQIVDRGGLEGRIEGVILLDAVFGDAGIYAAWLARNHHRAFLYALYTRSSMAETTMLKTSLIERNIAYATRDDGGPLAGVRLVETDGSHGEVPVKGDPIAALLRRLQP
ncbi:MAG TPA: hypothetical protein VIF14_03495 [Alphaproteobacteria bacterium]